MALTPRQYRALTKQWERHHRRQANMLAALRADLHNGSEMLQRRDKRAWEPADFGAEQRSYKHPRSTMTPEQVKRRAQSMWGQDGRRGRGPRPSPELAKFKESGGQPIPINFQRKA